MLEGSVINSFVVDRFSPQRLLRVIFFSSFFSTQLRVSSPPVPRVTLSTERINCQYALWPAPAASDRPRVKSAALSRLSYCSKSTQRNDHAGRQPASGFSEWEAHVKPLRCAQGGSARRVRKDGPQGCIGSVNPLALRRRGTNQPLSLHKKQTRSLSLFSTAVNYTVKTKPP